MVLNIFLFKTLMNQKVFSEKINKELSNTRASERFAWKSVNNVIEYNDFELFKQETTALLNLKGKNNPIIIINRKQCQACIDELMKNIILLEDTIKFISEIKYVIIIDPDENQYNTNFLATNVQETFIIKRDQLAAKLKVSQLPGVFFILTDKLGRIKIFIEYDVNYSNCFMDKLITINENYLIESM